VDRITLHEQIGNATLQFFDSTLNVRRERPK
jgi:hypothetical protein